MGERLVVGIIENSKPKCAIYYHWSGYTSSTIGCLQNLLQIIYDEKQMCYSAPNKILKPADNRVYEFICRIQGKTDDDFIDPNLCQPEKSSDWLYRVIRTIENDGGGLEPTDSNYEAAKEKWPGQVFSDEDHIHRNEGLIALSEDAIKDFCDYGEHFAEINLDNKTIGFDLGWINESETLDILNGEDEEEKDRLINAPVAPYDFEDMLSFSEFKDFVENHAEKLLAAHIWKRPNHPHEYFVTCM